MIIIIIKTQNWSFIFLHKLGVLPFAAFIHFLMKKREISSWRGSLRRRNQPVTHLLAKELVLIVAIQKADLAAHSLEGRESNIWQGGLYSHNYIKTMVKFFLCLFVCFFYLWYLSETCDSPVGLLLEPHGERKAWEEGFSFGRTKGKMEINECDLR